MPPHYHQESEQSTEEVAEDKTHMLRTIGRDPAVSFVADTVVPRMVTGSSACVVRWKEGEN